MLIIAIDALHGIHHEVSFPYFFEFLKKSLTEMKIALIESQKMYFIVFLAKKICSV
jgi:hypothetical protein